MTQDKAPEWAKAEGHRIAMELVPSMALTFDHSHGLKDYDARKAAELPYRQIAQHEVSPAIALAISQAYERGQESMRERAAGTVDTALVADFTRKAGQTRLNSEAEVFLANAIRSLPIEQEGGE